MYWNEVREVYEVWRDWVELNLNSNIHRYRKERKLTQEQLAEAMGVTVGAVSKWENGLSSPDIMMVAELADFFEISVDVLLGYQWEKRSMGGAAERIRELVRQKNYQEAKTESLKALQKYPNSFEVVHVSAMMEYSYGIERRKKEALEQAIRLLERANELIEQNQDERVSSVEIQIKIAMSYKYMDQFEEAILRLKKVNPCGVKDLDIGQCYLELEQYEEGNKHLGQAFEDTIISLVSTIMSSWSALVLQNQMSKSLQMSMWLKNVLETLADGGAQGYLLKFLAFADTILSINYLILSEPLEAEKCLKSAVKNIRAFVSCGNYHMPIRFIQDTGRVLADDSGESEEEYFQGIIGQLKDMPEVYDSFERLYRKVKEEEK